MRYSAIYDAPGKQVVVNSDSLTYDAENRMTLDYDPIMHSTESYVYDGNGQRVQKTGPGANSGVAVTVPDLPEA